MSAATVSNISGAAYVLRNGQRIELSQGTAIEQTDVVHTEADAKLTLRFSDDSIIELGPSTQIAVDDFAFDPSGLEAPSFGLHMMGGVVRSISGKIVEQNPESFRLTSPLGAVGIRGTETLHVIGDGTESHAIINIGPGHSVVISDNSGNSVVLTQPFFGVNISGSETGQGGLDVFEAPRDWFEQFLTDLQQMMVDQDMQDNRLVLVMDAETQAALEGTDVPENVMVVTAPSEQLEEALEAVGEEGLTEESTSAILDILEEITQLVQNTLVDDPFTREDSTSGQTGTGSYGNTDNTDNVMSGSGPSSNNDYLAEVIDAEPEHPAYPKNYPTESLTLNGTNGNDTIYAYGGDDVIHGFGGDDLIYAGTGMDEVYGGAGNDTIIKVGTMTGFALYGDEYSLSAQTGGNDSIILESHDRLGNAYMFGGNIYGDAWSISNNSVGGNDTIRIDGSIDSDANVSGDADFLENSIGGNDVITVNGALAGKVFGDADMMSTSTGGHDSITVDKGAGGSIYGDAVVLADVSVGGNDTITIKGDFSGAIYGDGEYVTDNGHGGNDSIVVHGTVNNPLQGGIYGDAYELSQAATGGNDYIYVNSLGAQSSIYGDAFTIVGGASGGNDTIIVDSISRNGGAIYGDADNFELTTGGNDYIELKSALSGSAVIYGDAQDMGSGAAGGNDYIQVHSMSDGGTIYGDAFSANNFTSFGSDTISVENGIVGTAAREGYIFGDCEILYNGSNAGDDSIGVTGDVHNAHIFGDALTVNSGTAGNDTIYINGSLINSVIYGDMEGIDPTAPAGNAVALGTNRILVNLNVEGSAIYGSHKVTNANTSNITSYGSGNEIHVGGFLSGDIAVFNLGNETERHAGGTMTSTVSVYNYLGGSIYTGANTNINIDFAIGHSTVEKEIYGLVGGREKITINAQLESSSYINFTGVDANDSIILSNRYSGSSTLQNGGAYHFIELQYDSNPGLTLELRFYDLTGTESINLTFA